MTKDDWTTLWETRPRLFSSDGIWWPAMWNILYCRRRWLSITERLPTTLAVDFYLGVCWFLVLLMVLACLVQPSKHATLVLSSALILCAVRYLDIMGVLLQVWFMRGVGKTLGKGGDIVSGGRTVLLTVGNMVELCVLFAVTYFCLEKIWPKVEFFRGELDTLGNALYFSVVTAATLGAGDFHPTHSVTRALAMAEVLSVLIVVLSVIHVASRPLTMEND